MTERSSKTAFTAVACCLYALVAAGTWVAAALWPGHAGYPLTGDTPLSSTLLTGLAAGVAVAAGSAVFATMTESGKRLTRLLGEALEGIPWWGAAALATAAGIAEEALFRGTLWSLLGSFFGDWGALGLTSILFGAAHGMFRGRFVAWSAFALVVGVLLGVLRLTSGGVVAPAVAHVVVDMVNIPIVVRLSRSDVA